jgi:hypothetical protein
MLLLCLALSTSIVVGGCQLIARAPSSPLASPRAITTQAGRYYGVAWLPGDWIVVGFSTNEDSRSHLWKMRPDGSQFTMLPLADPACRIADYQAPVALGDGRLGFVKACSGPSGPANRSLWAYDLASGASQQLAAIPDQDVVDFYSWKSDLSSGWFSSGSQICEGIAAMDRTGIQPLDVTVGDGYVAFTLQQAYVSGTQQPDCPNVGWAIWPAWSARNEVAFFASTAAAPMSGFDRDDAPASIYLWSEGEPRARPILNGLSLPRSLAWSPTGVRLSVSGLLDSVGGTWILDPAAGDPPTRLTSGRLDWVAWSPSGDRLAGVNHTDRYASPAERVAVVDVPQQSR